MPAQDVTPTLLDRAGIERAIPHRPPFLLVDSVLSIEPGASLRAAKRATGGNWWVASSTSCAVALPHCLVLEALAQAGGILLAHSAGDGSLPGAIGLLTRIRSCAFGRQVLRDDEVLLACRLVHWRRSIAVLATRATVEHDMVAEAEIAFIIKQAPNGNPA